MPRRKKPTCAQLDKRLKKNWDNSQAGALGYHAYTRRRPWHEEFE